MIVLRHCLFANLVDFLCPVTANKSPIPNKSPDEIPTTNKREKRQRKVKIGKKGKVRRRKVKA